MLTDNDIKKFQKLYKEEFGTNISKEEATEQGLKLVTLMSNVYKPMNQEEFNEVEKHRISTKEDLIKRI
jgi:hypothetical protein